MRRIAAAMVEDKNGVVEIDDVSSTYSIDTRKTVKEETDIFKMPIDFSKLTSKKMQKRYQTIEKNLGVGTSGAGSKFEEPELVNGYGMFDVVEPPYNLEVLASLFEENAIHNASIMARTMNTVGLGYTWVDTPKSQRKVERATAKSKEDSLSRVRQSLQNEEEKMNEIFDNFNIDDSFIETMIKVWIDYLTVGNGYIEISRNNNGEIGYVGHIPAIYIRVRRARDGFVQRAGNKWVFFRNFQDKVTPDPINNDKRPNEIIHFKAYTPTNRYYGVPSAVSAISAIIGDKFAKEYNIDYFENKSIPRYAIILRGANLSTKAKTEIVNYFKNEVKGNNHGTLLIPIPSTLGKDVDLRFEKLEDKIQDSSFDKYRKGNRDEITVAHRVPAPKIGIYDNANLAVSRDADKTFKMQVVGPDQKVIEKKVNRIVSEFTDLKKFKFAEIDLIDEDLRSRIHDRYLRTEVMTPNEVRQEIRLTAREGGDDMLPYPTKVQQDKNAISAKFKPESLEGLEELDIEVKPAGNGGGQFGNNNSLPGSPPKSIQDSKAGESSDSRMTNTNAERGEAQDGGST